jgi:hypothetical protein
MGGKERKEMKVRRNLKEWKEEAAYGDAKAFIFME